MIPVNWIQEREVQRELFYKWVQENLSNDQKKDFWKLYTDYVIFKAKNEIGFWARLYQDLKNK
jgi:hypothetical protein